MGKLYQYTSEQYLPIHIKKAWQFFSLPANLSLITPPGLDFKIIGEVPDIEIYEGMIINYSLRPIFGFRFKWQTEILDISKPYHFTDRQLKGPYKIWEHTHRFIESENGVLIKDEVNYQLPLSIIGRVTHFLSVRNRIARIFEYRRKVLEDIVTMGHKSFANGIK